MEEAGSGFIIQEGSNFYVLTNCHVVRLAHPHDIKIRLADGRQIHPLRVWQDPETDVAVMAISTPNLVASKLGNSDDVEIGDFVLALGSPFGLSHSTTFGIISAESRRDLELGSEVKYQDFLQTDAAINPGNSGGPLINLRGEVIGMNTAIASSSGGNEGIGFTIPINMIKVISHQLVDQGRVVRGRIGIHLDEKYGAASATNVGLQLPRGAGVTDIEPGTPAEAAHLQAGDVIVKFDNVRVENRQHLKSLVSLTEIGRDVPVVISRGGKTMQVTIHVAAEASNHAASPKRGKLAPAGSGCHWLGFGSCRRSADQRDQFGQVARPRSLRLVRLRKPLSAHRHVIGPQRQQPADRLDAQPPRHRGPQPLGMSGIDEPLDLVERPVIQQSPRLFVERVDENRPAAQTLGLRENRPGLRRASGPVIGIDDGHFGHVGRQRGQCLLPPGRPIAAAGASR